MHNDLIQLFNQIAPLANEDIELIQTSFKPYQLKKGDYFLKAGEKNEYIAFLQQGLVRYFVDKNNTEATFEFTQEGEFIGDYQSFTKQTPSLQYIQAIEDCSLLRITLADVQHIFNHTKHGNKLGRIIVEHRFDVMVNQLLSIYMQNPEDRYKRFVANYTNLAQRIPQYLIASYVGIQPQSLSRMRKRFAQENKPHH